MEARNLYWKYMHSLFIKNTAGDGLDTVIAVVTGRSDNENYTELILFYSIEQMAEYLKNEGHRMPSELYAKIHGYVAEIAKEKFLQEKSAHPAYYIFDAAAEAIYNSFLLNKDATIADLTKKIPPCDKKDDDPTNIQ